MDLYQSMQNRISFILPETATFAVRPLKVAMEL